MRVLRIAALTVGLVLAGSLGGLQVPRVEAGDLPLANIDIDVDTGTAGIQAGPLGVSGVGTVFTVDILITNIDAGSGGLGSFNFDVVYDDSVIQAADKVGGSPTNNNPLVNTAVTDSTGRAFNCFDPGIPSPKGDGDATVGAGHGRATLACTSTGIPNGVEGAGGVVATLTFQTAGGGSSTLALENVAIGDPTGFVSFDPTLSSDRTVNVTGAATTTPVAATATSTATATPTATKTPCTLDGGTPCPTPSFTFKTETSTATPSPTGVAESPSAGTPASDGTTPPGSGAGPGATTPRTGVTLPDTGSRARRSDSGRLVVALGGVLGAIFLTGGLYLLATRRETRP